MVEESTQTNQDEEQAMYSNDNLVRAQVMEIPEDMPEEVKKQLQQFNEMSMMLNNSLDNPVADDDSDEDDEDDEDDDDEETIGDSSTSQSPVSSYSEDSNAVYSDIF